MRLREEDFWKFNNSSTSNAEYVKKRNGKSNFETLRMLDQCKITDKHLRWEYLKYEIWKFIMNVSKIFVKEENKDRNSLEKELKN